MILVTGAAGSVGQALLASMDGARARGTLTVTGYEATDLDELDVTDLRACLRVFGRHRPRLVYHLAGAKHAPEGEVDPAHVSRVNVGGSLNVLEAARMVGAHVVMSSTCKACDPETAYGASKLIAERAVLNAGGTVVRFHNIPESSGNVFRLWEALPPGQPLPVMDCERYFTPMRRAVELLVLAAELGSGRYLWDPGEPRAMAEVAAELYPGREQLRVPRRRGDRAREPLLAACETGRPLERHEGFLRVTSPHDAPPRRGIVADVAA